MARAAEASFAVALVVMGGMFTDTAGLTVAFMG
jgi:hypothetical protein